MQRSPIPQHDMKTFLKEMRRTSSGTVTVSKLLAAKIQSSSEAQAIHAFEVPIKNQYYDNYQYKW